MEASHKVFLFVFLSIAVLCVYVVFIHPSQDDSEEFNSDFQQGDQGNGTQQPELTQQDIQNTTQNNTEEIPGRRENIPYKVVLPGGETQNRNFSAQLGYGQPSDQIKNADGTLDQEVRTDLNPISQPTQDQEGRPNPQNPREGGGDGSQLSPESPNYNQNQQNREGHEEEDDRDKK